ncbi:hypothetical protein BYT27DRAFT_7258868 [Phlegmacium glaucopus]|nr:hypothetical protein BYT27DRAFT_7258868 [Phlegmacium glaucopus]
MVLTPNRLHGVKVTSHRGRDANEAPYDKLAPTKRNLRHDRTTAHRQDHPNAPRPAERHTILRVAGQQRGPGVPVHALPVKLTTLKIEPWWNIQAYSRKMTSILGSTTNTNGTRLLWLQLELQEVTKSFHKSGKEATGGFISADNLVVVNA